MSPKKTAGAVCATTVAALLLLAMSSWIDRPAMRNPHSPVEQRRDFLVQADSATAAADLVRRAGGEVLDELGIIRAVGASLTASQRAEIQASGAATLYEDRGLTVSQSAPETHFPGLIGAADLHVAGLTGRGVSVAVLDTGIWTTDGIDETSGEIDRVVAQYDVLLDTFIPGGGPELPRDDDDGDDDDGNDDDDNELDEETDGDADNDDELDDDEGNAVVHVGTAGSDLNGADGIDDWSGHGTHVTSIIAGSRTTNAARYQGVAPGVDVVAVKAFEPDGSARYIDVIKGLDWIVEHRERYGIRVLNLSFSGRAVSRYWEDPLNQAVMAAWQAGIVVVAAAGNSGPAPMTVGVPGNIPYVITVGAMTDSYTPVDPTDDVLASWSSAGPTHDGFVKPDLVAPGGHLLGIIPDESWIALEYPQYFNAEGDYFTMSGTSQATAVVAGVVALMLESDPSLTPDDVKCRLMATARSAEREDGSAAYSVFQQGAGMIDALAATNSGAANCANQDMDISLDLAGTLHYGGPARQDSDGRYFLTDPADPTTPLDGHGYSWQYGPLHHDRYLWKKNTALSGDLTWSRGASWSEDSRWQNATIDTDRYLWKKNLTEPVSINRWVEQE